MTGPSTKKWHHRVSTELSPIWILQFPLTHLSLYLDRGQIWQSKAAVWIIRQSLPYILTLLRPDGSISAIERLRLFYGVSNSGNTKYPIASLKRFLFHFSKEWLFPIYSSNKKTSTACQTPSRRRNKARKPATAAIPAKHGVRVVIVKRFISRTYVVMLFSQESGSGSTCKLWWPILAPVEAERLSSRITPWLMFRIQGLRSILGMSREFQTGKGKVIKQMCH